MEYNINLPANLSPKEWKATANAAKTKAKSKRDRKRAQITNSKKLKMYRKNKWNWMVQRWTVKRQRKRNDALIKCFCLFWLVLWLFCFSRFALQPQHHFEMYGSGNLRCASVTWQAIRKTMLTSHISVPEPTTKTMRRKIRTRIAEKSRKLIGEILFMANSKCERIYNLVGCVALTTHLSIWWANRFGRQRKTDCKWTHINRCACEFRHRFHSDHEIAWSQSSSDQCDLVVVSTLCQNKLQWRQSQPKIECGCFSHAVWEKHFVNKSINFRWSNAIGRKAFHLSG